MMTFMFQTTNQTILPFENAVNPKLVPLKPSPDIPPHSHVGSSSPIIVIAFLVLQDDEIWSNRPLISPIAFRPSSEDWNVSKKSMAAPKNRPTTYWCVLRREWMGLGVAGMIIISDDMWYSWDLSRKFPTFSTHQTNHPHPPHPSHDGTRGRSVAVAPLFFSNIPAKLSPSSSMSPLRFRSMERQDLRHDICDMARPVPWW